MSTYDDWSARAACASRLDLPWLTDHADVHPWDAVTMAAICDGCPVVLDCLAAVDALDVTGGWWAGVDRDPQAHAANLAPAWATRTSDVSVTGTTWEPLTTRRGQLVGAQGTFSLGSAA